jgi:hypothetical protein
VGHARKKIKRAAQLLRCCCGSETGNPLRQLFLHLLCANRANLYKTFIPRLLSWIPPYRHDRMAIFLQRGKHDE